MTQVSRQVEQHNTLLDLHTMKIKMLSFKTIDLEARSRRNNLVFWGIRENVRYSESIQLIMNFLLNELDIDPECICIERAHMLGSTRNVSPRYRNDPKRPIIVRFRDNFGTETVLERAYKLKGTSFRLNSDYPREIVEAIKNP